MKFTMRVLAASLLIATAPLALAQTTAASGEIDATVRVFDATAANKGQTQVAEKIAAFFTNLAGSKENAVALVNALRTGTAVNLTAPATGTGTGTGTTPPATTTTTFTPPTGKMGWGNVKISLGLAQDALLRAGITKPTAAQLQTALLGGTITKADGTTVELKGVLQMRADGMGWGQIAHAGGTKVGPVVSSLKSTQAELAKLPPAGTSTTTTATTTSTKSKGVATAAGATSSGAAKGSSGVVTAEGVAAGNTPKGNAYGRGLVTGAGTSAGGNAAATGHGKPTTGAGLVTGAGGSASAVTTGQGNAGGNGKGQGQGQGGGKGKGGG